MCCLYYNCFSKCFFKMLSKTRISLILYFCTTVNTARIPFAAVRCFVAPNVSMLCVEFAIATTNGYNCFEMLICATIRSLMSFTPLLCFPCYIYYYTVLLVTCQHFISIILKIILTLVYLYLQISFATHLQSSHYPAVVGFLVLNYLIHRMYYLNCYVTYIVTYQCL